MNSYPAEIPELVRAQRKDDVYITHIRTTLQSIVGDLCGARFQAFHAQNLSLAAELIYYSVTTLTGAQTLGEEYLGLIPSTSSSTPVIPSWLRRFVYVIGQVAALKVTDRLLLSAEKRFADWETNADPTLSEVQQNWIRLLSTCRRHLSTVSRLHLAVFYVFGRYYHLSKRLTNVRYVSLRAQTSGDLTLRLFRWLGYLTFIQCTIAAGIWWYSKVKQAHTKPASETSQQQVQSTDEQHSGRFKHFQCPVCLERDVPPSCSVSCGHVFCWSCLHEQAQQLAACPLCRMPLQPDRCIPIFNL